MRNKQRTRSMSRYIIFILFIVFIQVIPLAGSTFIANSAVTEVIPQMVISKYDMVYGDSDTLHCDVQQIYDTGGITLIYGQLADAQGNAEASYLAALYSLPLINVYSLGSIAAIAPREISQNTKWGVSAQNPWIQYSIYVDSFTPNLEEAYVDITYNYLLIGAQFLFIVGAVWTIFSFVRKKQ